ncbi:phage tail tape measure protein [Dickeya solani]|uniref:Phage tail tape measure protein n=1 Tax=Dickeya solani TaxID=1089444 RepID=A0ABU4EHB6_9GAMM|nr:phage tail tape measure protein [Dickeya solani]MCZ0823714.1 phage tail tape measure protein [Dickeya solani]MDV6995621.1 phage tail tape measure protein [Dickeya solani]MDV7002900.1 phage tail tape measure protein [Dickeya solani]MDV7036676.1 phage tail tape measure protein [Dickeya solani]MDV7043429.1 phage tail tape measure protein [Dickeya solani]
MADSFQLKAIITAVDKLSEPLSKMSGKVKSFQKEFTNTMAKAGALGMAIGTGMALPVSQAIAFESSMADVKKVVDFDTPQQFAQMGEDIMKLSERLPMAANDMAKIAAAGGQSGIARKDLMQFTEDAVKMGVAFDQTAEESGQMMAQWRTAFKMTQKDVVTLADKINYLGNNGPANAQKISEIVTRIGPLGGIAGVASGEVAALGATIAGTGVESEIAATGIKNFMMSLVSGKSATASQKKAFKALRINSAQLAKDMQKDSKTAILKVLNSLQKLPKEKQIPVMDALFGKESIGAIAPLLANLDLLKTNLTRVADAQQYAGSMQKEYEARAATTENSLKLLRNTFNVTGITIGSIFLPSISEASQKLLPFIEKFRTWVKDNPETIKSVMKFAGALVGVGGGAMVVSRAFGVMESVMRMSTAGKMVTLLVAGGWMIAENWDKVGPVVQKIWDKVDGVVAATGGWEIVLKSVAAFIATKWVLDMVTSIGKVKTEATALNTLLGATQGMIGKLALGAALYEPVNQVMERTIGETDAGNWAKNNGLFFSSDWKPFFNKQEMEKHQSIIDQQQKQQDMPLSGVSYKRQMGELKVSFENAPAGMQVTSGTSGQTPYWIKTDVGYNPYSKQSSN